MKKKNILKRYGKPFILNNVYNIFIDFYLSAFDPLHKGSVDKKIKI